MLRLCDGFDIVSADRVRQKYSGYNSTFDQSFVSPGRDSQNCFIVLNTAFGEANYTAIFDRQGVWGLHADVRISRAGTSNNINSPVTIFTIGDSLTTSFSVRLLPTLLLELRNAVTNGLIATSTAPLIYEQWHTIELRATCGGTAYIELHLDGATVAAGNTGLGGAGTPDRVTFRWQVFGPPSISIDNYVIYDGQPGDQFSNFTGRIRITSMLPTADVSTSWTPSSGGSCFAMVNDAVGRAGGAPDNDGTYITPTAADQLFSVETPPCYGLIYALAVNVAARYQSSSAVTALAQLAAGPRTLGTINAAAAYSIQQVFSAVDPDVGGAWRDAVIASGWFGLRSVVGGPRVSALFLEKVVSLVPRPYDCGIGNYSY